jgi:hypothetical protein
MNIADETREEQFELNMLEMRQQLTEPHFHNDEVQTAESISHRDPESLEWEI